MTWRKLIPWLHGINREWTHRCRRYRKEIREIAGLVTAITDKMLAAGGYSVVRAPAGGWHAGCKRDTPYLWYAF